MICVYMNKSGSLRYISFHYAILGYHSNELFIFNIWNNFFVEILFYLQSVYIHSANWCEDWVLWLGEWHSVVPFCSY
jgi:hypothetical protein